jgi:long-chain acyl-CoA synthetase
MFHIAELANAIACAINGGMMILVPNPRDTDFICAQLQKHPANIMIAVPALYDMMVANTAFAALDFSTLRVAISGAAPLTRGSYDALSTVIGANKISDAFGMTETAPCYTVNPPKRYKLGSIGFPIPNAKVRIRDVETGNHDMPYGEPGEIICTGPQVMKGYLNLPNESAKALREIDGERWMFSGDVGYMDEEGYIFLCDRAKDMLIVGGLKVFSVEVEDKLSAIPEIAACAVIGSDDKARPGNDIVNLYVELSADYKDADQSTVKDKILTFCHGSMAAYKAPKQIHFIEAIPLTPVGKIDKKALR